jgi:hypothetical protein
VSIVQPSCRSVPTTPVQKYLSSSMLWREGRRHQCNNSPCRAISPAVALKKTFFFPSLLILVTQKSRERSTKSKLSKPTGKTKLRYPSCVRPSFSLSEYLMKPKRALTSTQGKTCRSFAHSKIAILSSRGVLMNATSSFKGLQWCVL